MTAHEVAIGGTAVSIGPVEYIAIAFPGNKFSGEIIPALQALTHVCAALNDRELLFVVGRERIEDRLVRAVA